MGGPTMSNSPAKATPRGQLWLSKNYQRIRLIAGGLMILVAVWGLTVAAYFGAVLNGFVGAWLLGGWPAVRRLVRHPRMQLRHWYYVLIDARKYRHTHLGDGSVEVSEMRPTLTDGWRWRGVRWYERD